MPCMQPHLNIAIGAMQNNITDHYVHGVASHTKESNFVENYSRPSFQNYKNNYIGAENSSHNFRVEWAAK